ncbi:helix-turn-helix transcriptional regulator [Halomarina rubra]|uniref:Helix-turn-helix domain-containing protein n=1 Tax=Halomarina rubra TaxID=2071873 RepID=A0ABD6ASW5_9EURY|nr:helix-turn-helix domain-containing protein [Halomarina rubra]
MPRPPTTTTGRAIAVVVCLLLSTVAVAGAVPVSIDSVEFSGDGVIATDNGVTYVAAWQTQTITVGLSGGDTVQVCAQLGAGDDARDLSCSRTAGGGSVSLRVSDWGETTGEQTLTVVARNNSGTVDSVTRTVRVLAPGGDVDEDGLSNQAEAQRGTNMVSPDTDGDGLTDGSEVNVHGSNATNPDTDGDGLNDGDEVSTENSPQTDPTNPDTDGDGIEDGREQTSLGTNPADEDTDGDGLADGEEIVNGSDGYETDPTNEDSDGDGLTDGQEVNNYETDPTDRDTDDDGIPDGLEVSEENGYVTNPTNPDTDDDGLRDGEELNNYETNPTKPDTDGDGIPDGQEVEQGSDPAEGVGNTGLDVNGLPMVLGLLVAYALLVGAIIWVGRTRDDAPAAPEHVPTDGGSDGGETVAATPEPMTNEDRIRQMLDANDGRIRQADIVEQTDWSKSKVSRLLSKMEADGEVRKISIGRENLIARPGDEPESARSPFEEQS